MAKTIHMFELAIQVEPFRPGVERRAPFMPDVSVSAAIVAFCPRMGRAFAKILEDLSRPPMEMGIDYPHAGFIFSHSRVQALQSGAEICTLRPSGSITEK